MNNLAIEKTLPEIAEQANAEHEACQGAMRESLSHAVRCGELLEQAKTLVNHGGWLPWLAENCKFSERTAQAYMRLAKNWPELQKAQRVADLPMREALMLLADSKEPEEKLPILDDPIRDYVENLAEKASQAKTLEEVNELQKEYKAIRLLTEAAGNKILAKQEYYECEKMLETLDNAPIDITPSEDSRLVPLEREWGNGNPKIGTEWEELFFGVNMWQKNLAGYCALVGCWHTIQTMPEWGIYHGRPGWDAWGLEAAGPPRESWTPVFCEDHTTDIDGKRISNMVRMFLINGGRRIAIEDKLDFVNEAAMVDLSIPI